MFKSIIGVSRKITLSFEKNYANRLVFTRNTLKKTNKIIYMDKTKNFKTFSKNLSHAEKILNKSRDSRLNIESKESNEKKSNKTIFKKLKNQIIHEIISQQNKFQLQCKQLIVSDNDNQIYLPHVQMEKSGIIKSINKSVLALILVSRKFDMLKLNNMNLMCFNCLSNTTDCEASDCQISFTLQELFLIFFKKINFIFSLNVLMTIFKNEGKIDEKFYFHKLLVNSIEQGLNIDCDEKVSQKNFEKIFKEVKTKDFSYSKKEEKITNNLFEHESDDFSLVENYFQFKSMLLQDNIWNFFTKSDIRCINLNIQNWYLSYLIFKCSRSVNFRNKNNLNFFYKIFESEFKYTKIFYIDCRYEYEFNGGHIKGAFNINDPKVIQILFFKHKWINNAYFFDYLQKFRDKRIDEDMAHKIIDGFKPFLLSKNHSNKSNGRRNGGSHFDTDISFYSYKSSDNFNFHNFLDQMLNDSVLNHLKYLKLKKEPKNQELLKKQKKCKKLHSKQIRDQIQNQAFLLKNRKIKFGKLKGIFSYNY